MHDDEILQLQRCRICSDWKAGPDQQNWVALLGIEGEVAGEVAIRDVNREFTAPAVEWRLTGICTTKSD